VKVAFLNYYDAIADFHFEDCCHPTSPVADVEPMTRAAIHASRSHSL